MKVSPISTSQNNPYKNFQTISNKEILKNYIEKKPKTINKKKTGLAIGTGILLAIGIGAQLFKKFDYKSQLIEGIKKETGKKIKRNQLKSVVGKKEFMGLLKNLKEENYIASAQNIANGTFQADLHSHTWHSDGWGIVENIMNEVAQYGDELHKKTGKKFLFAITDHDTLKGTKEALEIIADNPKKFENVKFVTGVELSFIQETKPSNIEGAELLAHCINPYSKKINNFIDNLHKRRGEMIEKTIEKLNSTFQKECFFRRDMDEFYLKKPDENFVYNLHWRVLNYAQVKNKINELANHNQQEAQNLYYQLMPQWHMNKNFKGIKPFVEFLQTKGCNSEIPANNEKIGEICKDIFPKVKNGKIISEGENTFEDLINLFKNDKNSVVGFAHPIFTFKSFKNREAEIKKLIKQSNGIIKTTEKYHQGYEYPIKSGATSQKEVSEINQEVGKFNLLNLGGRDNHRAHFFDN